MIIRQDKEDLIFITQHDHANIAGEMFTRFKKDFLTLEHLESLKFAVHQHDRAWIIPDSQPLMNDLTKMPYSFIDYPENLKLHFYKLGIEQVDQANSYAAILCSMHYASAYEHSLSESGKSFYEREKLRQKHLMNKLKIPHDGLLKYQLRILQLCDDISLYICMNKLGSTKDEEIDIFKHGFKNSEFFTEFDNMKIIAYFKDKNTLKFNHSPFEDTFQVTINAKRIAKSQIEKEGLMNVYQREKTANYIVKIQ